MYDDQKLDCKFTCSIKSFTEVDKQNQLTASIQGLETLTTYDMDIFYADLTLHLIQIFIYVYFSFQHLSKMKSIFMLHLPKYFQLKIYRTKQHGILNKIRVL